MNKDWKGNDNFLWKTLGATNHTDKNRANLDYYATESKAAELLIEAEHLSNNIWECAVGGG